MKKIIVVLASALVLLLGATATVGCATSDKTYTDVETDALISELQKQIEDNEADLAQKIGELQNATRITDVKFSENGDLIITFGNGSTQTVKAPEETDVETDNLISELQKQIDDNEAEFSKKISELQKQTDDNEAEFSQKISELQKQIDDNKTELSQKISELQKATRVTDVKFSENGDLIITFGDGSTKTVKATDKHVHTFGEYKCLTTGTTVYCENRLFYRICNECKAIEWKNGEYTDHDWQTVTTLPTCQTQGYDTKTCKICGKVETENYIDKVNHAWKENYSYDNDYHWYDCTTCDNVKGKDEHTVDDSGVCNVCKNLVGATAGVVYTLSNDKTYYTVTDYKGTATRVRIADKYNGLSVTEVSGGAFYANADIIEVIIPTGVTAIGDSAFYECTSLTKIDLPATLLSIGTSAFSKSAITKVVMADSVTKLGKNAFYDCTNLTSATLSNSVTSIVEGTFGGCSILESLTIPDSVTSISKGAFSGCTKLINKVKGIFYVDDWVIDSDATLVKADILEGTRGIGGSYVR